MDIFFRGKISLLQQEDTKQNCPSCHDEKRRNGKMKLKMPVKTIRVEEIGIVTQCGIHYCAMLSQVQ